MDFKEILSYWKLIGTLVVLVASTTYSVIVYAENEKAVMRAEQQLIHNELYQESRIDRKTDRIQDNRRAIKIIESDDDELTLEEQKYIEALRLEITLLEKEIEEIRAKLITGNE